MERLFQGEHVRWQGWKFWRDSLSVFFFPKYIIFQVLGYQSRSLSFQKSLEVTLPQATLWLSSPRNWRALLRAKIHRWWAFNKASILKPCFRTGGTLWVGWPSVGTAGSISPLGVLEVRVWMASATASGRGWVSWLRLWGGGWGFERGPMTGENLGGSFFLFGVLQGMARVFWGV